MTAPPTPQKPKTIPHIQTTPQKPQPDQRRRSSVGHYDEYLRPPPTPQPKHKKNKKKHPQPKTTPKQPTTTNPNKNPPPPPPSPGILKLKADSWIAVIQPEVKVLG